MLSPAPFCPLLGTPNPLVTFIPEWRRTARRERGSTVDAADKLDPIMVREILETLGLNPMVLAAGGAGGLLRALSSKQHTLRERLVSPVCGALAAGYLTPVVVYLLRSYSVPLPFDDPLATFGAVGFVLGVSAMWISDAFMLFVLQRLGRAA